MNKITEIHPESRTIKLLRDEIDQAAEKKKQGSAGALKKQPWQYQLSAKSQRSYY